MPDLFPAFVPNVRRFVDLFAGGFNVGINVDAHEIYCNDRLIYVVELFEFLQGTLFNDILNGIYARIEEFALTNTNEAGYNQFRAFYNENPHPLDLFILTCYAFNHQIRFNSRHEFNSSFGRERSAYNDSIERNLISFCTALKQKNIIFSAKDYLDFKFDSLEAGDFVYCDPPYHISTGPYNDGSRGFKDWTDAEEHTLLELLDCLDENDIYFALSNVFYHKGDTNDILIKWSQKYNVTYLDKTYSNCSYQFKEKGAKTVEVLVTNY